MTKFIGETIGSLVLGYVYALCICFGALALFSPVSVPVGKLLLSALIVDVPISLILRTFEVKKD